MIFIYLFFIFLFSLLLIKATDILIINLKAFAKASRMGDFVVTTLILALATSLPEFFVGITSALEGQPNLSLGNVVGSNIANISLVIGGAALIGGSFAVRGVFLRRDVFYAFLAGAAHLFLLLDRGLSRVDGLILLALYGFYNVWVLAERRKEMTQMEEEGIVSRFLRRLNHKGTRRELGWIFLGMALLLFSADMIVRLAMKIALGIQIPIFLVGLFLVSVGTTLPELAFEIKVVRKQKSSMVFGNLLGSIVANGTLIIGVVSLISPIKIQAFEEYLLATVTYVVIFSIFYYFIRTKRKLERWEGAFLIGFYLAFVLAEFVHP
jgi:cation:H+ antiporter